MQAVISNRLIASLKPDTKTYEVRDVTVKGFMIRVQPTGKMTYAVQYGRARKLTIGPVGILTPAQAREKAQTVLADAIKGHDPQEAKRKARAHSLKSYIDEVYAPWAEIHQRSSATTISRIKANFFPILGKHKLGDITPWQIEKWRSERLKAGVKPASINRYVATLKAALQRAVTWGHIQANPLAAIKPLRLDSAPKVRYLANAEENRLRAALDGREALIRQERTSANQWRAERGYKLLPSLADGYADHVKPLIILALNTGLRRGEMLNLAWQDVDLDRAMLTVKGEGAKSKQTRHVPLNDEAADVLTTWKAQSKTELVFPGKTGDRLTNINSAWRKLLKEADIKGFRFHDLRHDFASRLVMAGVDLNTVRELLGHSDYKMTLRYSHLSPEVKAAAVQKRVRPVETTITVDTAIKIVDRA